MSILDTLKCPLVRLALAGLASAIAAFLAGPEAASAVWDLIFGG